MNITQKLYEQISEFEIIDAHEHLYPEKIRLSLPVSVFTLFFHYTHADFINAGMSRQDYDNLNNPNILLETRWKNFAPFWENTKYTSYAKSSLITAKEIYGFDDINENTYIPLSEKIQAMNKKGIYNYIFEKCKIKYALTQSFITSKEDLPLKTVWHISHIPIYELSSLESLEKIEQEEKISLKTGEDIANYVNITLKNWKEKGIIGLKIGALKTNEPTFDDITKILTKLRVSGSINTSEIRDFVVHRFFLEAGKFNLPVAIHTGMIWTNYQDYRIYHPKNLIPYLLKYQDTKFDIYHAGIPWSREVGIIGKTFPNTWLNLCWCHIISQQLTCSFLKEWLDLVPVNKIIGFGGDYKYPVEKIYGHLTMAKEDIAKVLGEQIENGKMNYDQALKIAKKWFYDNPAELYGLK